MDSPGKKVRLNEVLRMGPTPQDLGLPRRGDEDTDTWVRRGKTQEEGGQRQGEERPWRSQPCPPPDPGFQPPALWGRKFLWSEHPRLRTSDSSPADQYRDVHKNSGNNLTKLH